MLDRLVPTPRLVQTDTVEIAAAPALVWEHVRHADLAATPLVRALFSIRTLGDGGLRLRLDDMVSTPARPGFQLLAEDPPHELAVGAIGKVWQLDIPFVHVPHADAFAAFDRPGYVKVAWALRVEPRGERDSRVTVELRVDATDDEAWHRFRPYFAIIGPASHLIRRSLLAGLGRALGTPQAPAEDRPLPGDDLLPDAAGQLTHFVDVAASPETIWPWLVQMGCRRGGFYSYDLLDNRPERSAREVYPEWQRLAVGDRIPATPSGDATFEVLRLEAPGALVLGGLYDVDGRRELRFADPRPARYWQATWAFALERRDAQTTRLHVRARVAFPPAERLHAAWIRPVHHFMETAQLAHLKARAEGRLPRDDGRDRLEGAGGAAIMTAALLTPFLRGRRARWGLDAATAARALPGDELVPEPRWSWTHGIEIEAPAERTWPWVAQIGADRGGFYSYQWLENLAGCELRNAETIHPEWQVREGDGLVLHPRMPPLRVVALEPGRHFVALAPRQPGETWATATWLFLVEPLGPARCRFVSRYRIACSDDVATRLRFGPALVEPVGFAMDRRMLLGVKARAERGRPAAPK
jgi:hypothetical protein